MHQSQWFLLCSCLPHLHVEHTVHVWCRTHRTAAEAATAAAVRHCLHPPGFVPLLCVQCRLITRVVGWVTDNLF